MFYLLLCLFLAVECAPFLVTQTPALMDYPNHLAVVYVLTHWATNPWFQQYYQLVWRPIPDLAFDGLAIAFSSVAPIFVVGQAVLVITVVLIATGVAALSAALHGQPQRFCLIAFLFIFSEMFTYGLISDLLGFGICLWGIAIWLKLRRGSATLAIASSSCMAFVLFFAHLFAFAAYAVILASIEAWFLSRGRAPVPDLQRALLVAVPQFVLPTLIFFLFSPAGLKTGIVLFGSLTSRIELFLSPVRNYWDSLDVFTFLALSGFLSFGLLTKRLVIHGDMRPTLVVLGIASVLIPSSIAGGESAQIRLPTLCMLVLAASSRWQARGPHESVAAAVLFASLFLARTLVVVQAFDESTRFVDQLKLAIATLPRGAKVASTVFKTPAEHGMKVEWFHYICLAVIEKSAFVPQIFTYPVAPLRLAPLYHLRVRSQQELAVTSGAKFLPRTLANLDYLVAINEHVLPEGYLPALDRIVRGDDFTLYRVPH